MTIKGTQITRLAFLAASASLAAACVAIVPTPGNTADGSENKSAPPATLCNIEGKQVQDLSDGTTKATITQSCEETVVFIQNLHDKHPKRCRVLTGGQVTELYIMPGESRTVSQKGAVERSAVQVGCVNDWNRSK
jgi:hypothetical protein